MTTLTPMRWGPIIAILAIIGGFIGLVSILNLSGIQERFGIETRAALKVQLAQQMNAVTLLMKENAALKEELAMQARMHTATVQAVTVLEAATNQDIAALAEINRKKDEKIKAATASTVVEDPPESVSIAPKPKRQTPALYLNPDAPTHAKPAARPVKPMRQTRPVPVKAKKANYAAPKQKKPVQHTPAKSKKKTTAASKKQTRASNARTREIAIATAQIEALWSTYCQFNTHTTCATLGGT